MKKIAAFVFLVLSWSVLSAQNHKPDDSDCYDTIIEQLKRMDLYGGIKNINIFLRSNPGNASMYYNRGVAEYIMNDFPSSREDLIHSRKLGLHGREKMINFLTSKSYAVNILSKSYINFYSLDPDHGYKPHFGLKDSLQGALRPERTCYDVYYYDLTVKILPKSKSIEGSNMIYFRTTSGTNKIQVDLSQDFRIIAAKMDGKELKYTRVFNAVFIEFDETLPANENRMVMISYSGQPREAPSPPWNGGFIWKHKRSHWWVGVACEHLGASSWWPCKDHLSEKPDSMTINIQVPKGYQAISNGNLRSVRETGSHYTNFEWFVSYPINSYGVTFYMGKFINFNESFCNANGSYQIDYYVLPHHLKKAKKYYSQTKDIVKVYEELFGEYPYKKDGMAMIEAPYAGMEHQSAIAIGDDYGRRKRRNYEKKDYDYLVVHETAHEWWGNTVTMGDMADAWLSESFATYTEQLFMEKRYGYAEYVSACSKTWVNNVNIWPMVGIRDVNDNTFLGGDIYHKGAAMLNNLRCIINDDSVFFKIIRKFFDEYKFKIAETEDFIRFVNVYTSHDYTDFFTKFLYDAEPPVLHYDFFLDNDSLSFSYRWINVGRNFTMPFSITINDKENFRLNGTTDIQTFQIGNVKSFYLPNEHHLKKDQVEKNAFTYYWTSWKGFGNDFEHE